MVDVKAIARTLALAHAGECSVERVAQPIESEADDCAEEREAIAGRESVTGSCGNLRNKAKYREMVRTDTMRDACGQPQERAFFSPASQLS